MSMIKKQIVELIQELLKQELISLKQAALATYDAATNEESKPENQYDTRALEASYLAGAQAKRLEDVENLLFLCQGLKLRNFSDSDPIDLTALVQLEHQTKKTWIFLMPKGGGLKVQCDGQTVQTLTPQSVLGESLMGLTTGDLALVEDKAGSREYKILSVS